MSRHTTLQAIWARWGDTLAQAGAIRCPDEALSMQAEAERLEDINRRHQPEMAISDLSYGVHSVRRSTFTPDQIERLKALRDDLTTIIEREER